MSLKLKNFELEEGNYFIAMEYHHFILNRTYLILILEDYLLGLKVNDMVSVEVGSGAFMNSMTNDLAIQGDLQNPFSYVKQSYYNELENLDVFGIEIIEIDNANFRMSHNEITSVTYDSRKKWGMGYYPHDGKVYVRTNKGKKREFVILGSQSGEQIKGVIEKMKK